MKNLILTICLFCSLSSYSQSINLEAHFLDEKVYLYSIDDLDLLETYIYDSLMISEVDVYFNTNKCFNIYCGDPERPFFVSNYDDEECTIELYEFKECLEFITKHHELTMITKK